MRIHRTGTVDYGDGTGEQPLVIDQNNHTFDLNHAYTIEGRLTVTVTITDDDGSAHSDSLTVTVDLNTAPTAQNDNITTNQNTFVHINILADNGNGVDTDAENNIDPTRTINLTTPSGGSLVNNLDGTFWFDPRGAFDFLGVGETEQVTFDYQIEDDFGATSTGTVTITVTGVNDTPELS